MKVLCIHHNDNDGQAAAAVVKHYYRNTYPIAFFETDYKTPAPLDLIDKDTMVIIVDFSYPPEIYRKIEDKAHHIIWCDHHATCANYPYANEEVPGLRDFTEKGLSGCEVTWKFFMGDIPAPRIIKLVGDYDSWRLQEQPSCFFAYEGLKLCNTSPEDGIWETLFNDPYNENIDKLLQQGNAAILYRDNYCASIRKSFGYETEISGHKAYAMNCYRFGSQGFGETFKQYPICISYISDGERYTVSLYSETVDVSTIAKENGGGGHKGAAGFVCSQLPFKRL